MGKTYNETVNNFKVELSPEEQERFVSESTAILKDHCDQSRKDSNKNTGLAIGGLLLLGGIALFGDKVADVATKGWKKVTGVFKKKDTLEAEYKEAEDSEIEES